MSPRETDEIEHTVRSDRAFDLGHTLRLHGELTSDTTGEFERAIRAVLEGSPREIVIDLSELRQIDDAGLTALLKAHLRSRRRGMQIRFVPEEHAAVKQVVAVTGADEPSD